MASNYRFALVSLLLVAGLSGCGGPQIYKEPVAAPRANLRVRNGGAAVKYYPAADCFSYSNPDSGWASGVKNIDGMPLRPDTQDFTELYVAAGKPIAISFEYSKIQSTAGLGYEVSQCDTIGLSFTPVEGENYEATFTADQNGCRTLLERIVKDKSGNDRKVKMKSRRATRCSAQQKSIFKHPEGWDEQ